MIRALPVDVSRMPMVAAGPVTEVPQWGELSDGSRRPTGAQAKDDDGRLLWVVDALVAGERAEVVGVQVAGDEPVVEQFQPVPFTNLTVRVSKARDGSIRQYWSASGIASGKRSPVPSPMPSN